MPLIISLFLLIFIILMVFQHIQNTKKTQEPEKVVETEYTDSILELLQKYLESKLNFVERAKLKKFQSFFVPDFEKTVRLGDFLLFYNYFNEGSHFYYSVKLLDKNSEELFLLKYNTLSKCKRVADMISESELRELIYEESELI